MVIGGLHPDDRRDTQNIMRARAAGDIGGGPVQAEQNLAVRIRAADETDEFAGDIAGVQIGKNQDVRAAGHLAVPQFSFRDFRGERGVHLQFAVEIGFQKQLLRLAPGLGRGRLDFAHARVARAALGRILILYCYVIY